jgi:hypothetical protein
MSNNETYNPDSSIKASAKANFRVGLVALRNDIEWLAEELAKTADTPDKLEALIVELQKQYEELRKVSPKIWDGWKDEPREDL